MTPTYFVPQVQSDLIPSPDDPQPRQGVCFLYGRSVLADVGKVGADWFYDYGATAANMSDPRYIPMSWGGGYNLPVLPPDYSGYLLALNEPDNFGQLNITPTEAANRIRELANTYDYISGLDMRAYIKYLKIASESFTDTTHINSIGGALAAGAIFRALKW